MRCGRCGVSPIEMKNKMLPDCGRLSKIRYLYEHNIINVAGSTAKLTLDFSYNVVLIPDKITYRPGNVIDKLQNA